MPLPSASVAARRRRGRIGVLTCALGLLAGLVGPTAAADDPFVPPHEAAGVPGVVEGRGTKDEGREEVRDPAPLALERGGTPFAPPTPDAYPVVPAPAFEPAVESATIRGQSPEITLLPLATGEATVERTSLLGSLTGTQGRLRADYLTDLDETDRYGANLITSTWLGLGIDAEANYWRRPVTGLGRQGLWTGDLNVIYAFPPHPRYKLRSGAGAAWVLEDDTFEAGWNVSHAIDVYLLWRFMATGELDWGKIDDRDLFRYRVALGLTWLGAEFFTGYESFKLGGERLDGWVNGIAVWY